MGDDFRSLGSSLTNSNCGSNVSSIFRLNAHTQPESNSSLDKASENNQRFYVSSNPSPGRIGQTINLSEKLISQREPQLLINSNQTYSFRSNSSDSSNIQPSTSFCNTNFNHRIYSTESGRLSTSSYQNSIARNPNSIRQVGSDEIFYISTNLNPLTSTFHQCDPSQNQNLLYSQSPCNHINVYRLSHERVLTADLRYAIHNDYPIPRADIYTNPLPTPQNVPYIPLHNVQNLPWQTGSIHCNICVNPGPTMQQQPPQSLKPENIIFRTADKITNFNNYAGTNDLPYLLESPVLVPKGEVGTGSMVTLNNHSYTFNRLRSNGQTIYVTPVNDMSSSHPPSTVTTSVQCNRNEDHPIPVIVPISSKLTEAKSNDDYLIEYSKNTFSQSSEPKCINNKPLNKNLPQNSRDHSLTSKKKPKKPPKSTSKIRKRSILSPSHKISNKRYGFEISRSHNISKSSWSNLHRSSNLPHQSSKNSSPANIPQPDVSASSPSNESLSSLPANKSQLTESLDSPSLCVILNCPYNDAELVNSSPRSTIVTTINMTGSIIRKHLMNESNSIETFTQLSTFHDHQPGICSLFYSTNLVSSRDNTDNKGGSDDSTKPSPEKKDTDDSQRPSDSEPCDSRNSKDSDLKSHQTDADSLETQKTKRFMSSRCTSTARTRSNDSTSSQMSDGYALRSKVTCSHPDTNAVPTSCQIDIRKDRIQGHDQLSNIERIPNFHNATAARGNDPHSNVSHPQRFDVINYDEIESIDYEEKFLSNSHNICSSFQQNGSANRFDDLRKQQKISGSGGSSTQNSSNAKYKQTKILPFVQNIPKVQSITSKSRWVTLDSPIKRTVDLHGEVFHRKYFTSIKLDDLTLSVGDSVLRDSNFRSNSLPYVGISSAFRIDVRTRKPQSKNCMKYGSSTLETDRICLLLYYRPYHQVHLHSDLSTYGDDDELLVSKHVKDDPASYIIEICLVLTYSKHRRYGSFEALKSLIPTPLADRRPLSCFKNMEDLSNLLESDLKLFSSKLVDTEARRVSNEVSSIFPSPEQMCVSLSFSHLNVD